MAELNELKSEEKQEKLRVLLALGMAMIHVDARRGVVVPEHLRDDPHLLLNLSYSFDPPDLVMNSFGVRVTLTFAQKRYAVSVPWNAIFAMTSHVTQELFVFPSDVPSDQSRAEPRAYARPPPRQRHLRLVKLEE